MVNPETMFRQYEKMILKAAYYWAKRNPHIDLDDLVGEGNAIFCHCLQKHDPERGAFSTLLHRKLQNELGDYVMHQRNEICTWNATEITKHFAAKVETDGAGWLADVTGRLGRDAKEVVRVLFCEDLPLHPSRYEETPYNLAAA